MAGSVYQWLKISYIKSSVSGYEQFPLAEFRFKIGNLERIGKLRKTLF
jgi:hypothetical protein